MVTSPTGSDAPSSGNEGMTAEDVRILGDSCGSTEQPCRHADCARNLRILATYAAVERLRGELLTRAVDALPADATIIKTAELAALLDDRDAWKAEAESLRAPEGTEGRNNG